MKPLYKGIQSTLLVMGLGGMIAGCQQGQPPQEVSAPAPAAEESPQITTEIEEPMVEKEPTTPKEESQVLMQEEKKSPPIESKPKAEAVAPTDKPVKTAPSNQPAPVEAPPASPPQPTVKTETASVPAKQESVTLSIIGDEQTGTILNASEVGIEEGDTVLDILKKATKEKKIQLEYRGTGSLAYVEGINNLYEFDHGPKSGWMYRVNGVFGKSSAGHIAIKPNDQIEWVYTLDLGKDLK
ncbi:DUF4430 domain-containing protein [Ammoniphilus sp. 3BR4]|uniref:DUF4430 domain-containing protein n=1 Tax=Ammoniphilus sp. 3BR4 TaxID=3158265 RepID=UPI0034665A82